AAHQVSRSSASAILAASIVVGPSLTWPCLPPVPAPRDGHQPELSEGEQHRPDRPPAGEVAERRGDQQAETETGGATQPEQDPRSQPEGRHRADQDRDEPESARREQRDPDQVHRRRSVSGPELDQPGAFQARGQREHTHTGQDQDQREEQLTAHRHGTSHPSSSTRTCSTSSARGSRAWASTWPPGPRISDGASKTLSSTVPTSCGLTAYRTLTRSRIWRANPSTNHCSRRSSVSPGSLNAHGPSHGHAFADGCATIVAPSRSSTGAHCTHPGSRLVCGSRKPS